ncbi:hypothetical protein ASPZODRAFT_19280 [Penicilliopsis zonata CBS 506.65]|uniref:Uncharacterized protein n=1 Tax=Penicilliopsis zonata CBS 506.65 TaxID=1073090 RepID=A0A1L9S8S6_9EURO|nr:hypothetical protein ASPZODRAFT_19280 [Penicilliopsis zonata CBS 506.65]OJJ43557.1 hypothetical protein ASPZODRAFT_19280 [Penicilliopsis zonata CBS 506.65]
MPANAIPAELRKAKPLEGAPSSSDFQFLLAAIQKVEQRDKIQAPGRRVQVDDEGQPQVPANSPIGNPLRLRPVLDALASLCVSKPRGEVVAIAMECAADTSVTFRVATNSEVPTATVNHLQSMLRKMQEVSSSYRKNKATQSHEVTPDQQTMGLTNSLVYMCIDFSFEKWKKRIHSKLEPFLSIPHNDLPKAHPFVKTRVCIRGLVHLYKNKPQFSDQEEWRSLVIHLQDTQKATQAFIETKPVVGAESRRYEKFPSIETYLIKVNSLINHLGALVRATRSPHCEALLNKQCWAKHLPSMSTKVAAVPNTPEEWEAVLEKAASVQPTDYDLDLNVIRGDSRFMAQSDIPRDISVHCEIKILLDIFRNESPAYTYIGVSKLSCRGCHAFFAAFNNIHDTHFLTRGSHGKSYFPWQFPLNFPKSNAVADKAYRLLAERWVPTYHGYRPRMVHLQPDSTAGSGAQEIELGDRREDDNTLSLEVLTADLPETGNH